MCGQPCRGASNDVDWILNVLEHMAENDIVEAAIRSKILEQAVHHAGLGKPLGQRVAEDTTPFYDGERLAGFREEFCHQPFGWPHFKDRFASEVALEYPE